MTGNSDETNDNATSSKKAIPCDWCGEKIENPRPGQKHCSAKIRDCKKEHDKHIYRLGKNKDQKKSTRKTPSLKNSLRLRKLLKVLCSERMYSPLQLQKLTGITNIPQAVKDLKDNFFKISCKKMAARTGCGRYISFYRLEK